MFDTERWNRASAVVVTLLVVTTVVGPAALVEADTETTGRIQLGGSPVVAGTQYSYELQNVSAASDIQGTLTGVETTEWDNVSATGLANGDTLAVEPAGDEIRGPANGTPEFVITGRTTTNSQKESGTGVSPSGSASVSVDGNAEPTGPASGEPELSVTGQAVIRTRGSQNVKNGYTEIFSDPPAFIDEFTFSVSNPWSGQKPLDVYLRTNNNNFTLCSGCDASSLGSKTVNLDVETNGTVYVDYVTAYDTTRDSSELVGRGPQNLDVTASDGTTISLGNFSDGQTKSQAMDLSAGVSSLDFSGSEGSIDWTLTYTAVTKTENPKLDPDNDGTYEITYSGILSDGATATYEYALTTSDDTTTVSTAGGSTVDVAAKLREVSNTEDANVTVNGEEIASVSGTLAPGETRNFSASSALLQNGTNRVNVSMADLSADAPEPKVVLNYSHTAEKKLAIEKSNEALSQRIETNATYYSNQEDVTQRIDFGEGIVAVRSLEYCINGSDCQPLSSEQYRLENTTVIASIGDVQAETTVTVRGVGSRIRVENASVQVTDPTVYGNSLDSELALSNVEGPVSIVVNASDRRLHYAYDESWDADETALVSADGSQRVRLPNAPNGGTMRLTTMPLAVRLDHGDVAVHVEEGSGNPTLDVRPGKRGGDAVTFVYHRTSSGQRYKLRSVTHAEVVDAEIAESPVTLEDDDSPETLKIIEEDPTKDDGGGGGGPLKGVVRRLAGLFGAVAAIAGIALLGSRVGGESTFTDEIVLVGGVLVVGIASLSVIDPTFAATIGAGIGGGFRNLGQSLGKAAGPIAIVGILSATALGWGYLKSRDTDIIVDGQEVKR